MWLYAYTHNYFYLIKQYGNSDTTEPETPYIILRLSVRQILFHAGIAKYVYWNKYTCKPTPF